MKGSYYIRLNEVNTPIYNIYGLVDSITQYKCIFCNTIIQNNQRKRKII